jgi:hypothetical protein
MAWRGERGGNHRTPGLNMLQRGCRYGRCRRRGRRLREGKNGRWKYPKNRRRLCGINRAGGIPPTQQPRPGPVTSANSGRRWVHMNSHKTRLIVILVILVIIVRLEQIHKLVHAQRPDLAPGLSRQRGLCQLALLLLKLSVASADQRRVHSDEDIKTRTPRIRSSTVPSIVNFHIFTGFFCPIRCARPNAWS